MFVSSGLAVSSQESIYYFRLDECVPFILFSGKPFLFLQKDLGMLPEGDGWCDLFVGWDDTSEITALAFHHSFGMAVLKPTAETQQWILCKYSS